jgi:hypothetical protein
VAIAVESDLHGRMTKLAPDKLRMLTLSDQQGRVSMPQVMKLNSGQVNLPDYLKSLVSCQAHRRGKIRAEFGE